MKNKFKRNRWILVAMTILLLCQLGVLLYYGTQKIGFHEDEIYSYYSTNKTAGLFVNDRQWLERDEFRNDFIVCEGEEFRYDVVAKMQSWDVHPPFYYFILHTICSFFPGIFSKWLGILVNLIAFVPCFILLWSICFHAVTAGEERIYTRKAAIYLAFATCMTWGFSAAVISGVMFIRMYQWLTLFVLLCAYLHVQAIKKRKVQLWTFYVPLMITIYLGFLTQYYYIIFHFFLGAGFCLILLKNKKIKELLCYVASCAIALLAAILSYPASLSHIFRGYRGTEAVSEFANPANTWERIQFFIGLFNDYVFHGTFIWWMLILCLVLVTAGYLKKRSKSNAAVGLLVFACLGYFFTIAKTALLLGETSNRYQLPIYGMLIFIILYFIGLPLLRMLEGKPNWTKISYVLAAIAGGVLVLTDVLALKDKKVIFLYQEEQMVKDYVKENKEVPVVVFYSEDSSVNVWRLSDELMEFPRVYLASQGNPELITDETIISSEKLLVYVADYADKEACLRGILKQNKNLSEYDLVKQKGLWALYKME